MGKFLTIHTFPSPMTPEEGAPAAKAVKAACTTDAYWVGSWVQLNEQGKVTKMFCEWDGKDAQSVRNTLGKVPNVPTDGVWPMAKVDGETYR
jgi:hypothetical protein